MGRTLQGEEIDDQKYVQGTWQSFVGLGAIPTLWGFRLAPKPYCWPHFKWSPTPETPFSQSHESHTLPAFLSDQDFGPCFPIEDLVSSTLDLSCFFLLNSELCFSPWLWFTPIEMMLGCVEKNQLQWCNKVEEDWGGKRHSTMSFTSQVPSLSSLLTSARLSSWLTLKVYPHGCKVAASPVASHFYPTTEEERDKEKLWAPIWGKSLKFPG